MTLENIRKAVNDFMNALLEENLIKITNFDEKTIKIIANSRIRHDLGLSVFKKIIDADKNSRILTDDEFSLFIFKYVLSSLNESIELVKIVLRAILNSEKIAFNEKTPYGDLLAKCFDKLHYDKIRPYMRDVFLIDLRNAFTHLEYEINGNVFSYHKQNGDLVTFNNEELKNIQLEYIETTETMFAFLKNYLIKQKK